MPKVSICIPTFQQVNYLEKALTSLLGQSFGDYEVVVTDDSPDDSVEVLLRRFDFSGRLKFIRNAPSLGTPCNWNHGINQASGEYIKILHHDDWFVSQDSLKQYVELIDSVPDVDFAFSGSRVVDVSTGRAWHNLCGSKDFDAIQNMPELLFCANRIGAPSATIFRRSAFGGGFDTALKWLVDIDFYIGCIKRSRKIAMTPDSLVVTPTNAAHQVTESCKSNALIELFEHQYLFVKYGAVLRCDKTAREFLRDIFEKYRVQTQSDLDLIGVERQLDEATFKSLNIRHPIVARMSNRISALFLRAFNLN